jgi:hypothetical protein
LGIEIQKYWERKRRKLYRIDFSALNKKSKIQKKSFGALDTSRVGRRRILLLSAEQAASGY